MSDLAAQVGDVLCALPPEKRRAAAEQLITYALAAIVAMADDMGAGERDAAATARRLADTLATRGRG